jgi:hypothetical protein
VSRWLRSKPKKDAQQSWVHGAGTSEISGVQIAEILTCFSSSSSAELHGCMIVFDHASFFWAVWVLPWPAVSHIQLESPRCISDQVLPVSEVMEVEGSRCRFKNFQYQGPHALSVPGNFHENLGWRICTIRFTKQTSPI